MLLNSRTALIAAILVAGTADAALADMTIYDHRGFTGESRVITDDIADLEDLDFDNKVSAVIVRSGTWILFRDDDFEGETITLGPGQYPNLEDLGFPRNTLSSIRAADSDAVSTRVEGGASELAVFSGCDGTKVPVLILDDGIELVCTEPEEAPRFVVESSAAARCVDVGSNAAGHRVRLVPCADTRQQKLGLTSHAGVPAGSFMLFAYADKCLSAALAAAGAPVGLEACRGDASQVWTPLRGAGNSSALVGPDGLCLAATPTGSDAWGATLAECTQAADQLWSIRSTEPFE